MRSSVSYCVGSLLAWASLALTAELTLRGSPQLPSTASQVLHPSLASFSIETSFFITYVGNVSEPNLLTKNLLQNLADRVGVPAEVRIGGITADSTFWNSSLDTEISLFIDDKGVIKNTTIGPKFWEAAKQVLPEGTKITMNLNLQSMNYASTLEVANATRAAFGSDLVALEIGNEPDHYNGYGTKPEAYVKIWTPWTKNLTTALNLDTPFFQVAATAEDPLWPYGSSQANAQLDCVSALAAGANDENTVKWCSEHTYQYSVCDPARTQVATLTNLVNHTRLGMYLDLWQPRINSVREQLGDDSFVIGEYNAVSCSGKDGVSNTFGHALWLLDTTLYAASINISRLYIHQGGPLAGQSNQQLNHGGLSFYNLWWPVDNDSGPVNVFPSYYAYLFIADTIGTSRTTRIANVYPGRQANGSTLTTAVGGEDSAGQVSIYGFWEDDDAEYPVKLAVLNMQIFNETQVEERPQLSVNISAFLPPGAQSTVKRLQAPGADIKSGNVTTWAGQSFPQGVADGSFVEEDLNGDTITLPASEAVLITFDS